MLDTAKLHDVTDIITHANCSDGKASALILRDVLPSATIHFMQYDTAEHKALEAKPGMLFCDFSPYYKPLTSLDYEYLDSQPRDRFREFIDAGTIVLDHHRSQKHVVEMFGENGVYADEKEHPGVSGAVLAYREVWLPLSRGEDLGGAYAAHVVERRVEAMARLIGIRDTWQNKHEDWRKALTLAEVLFFFPFSSWPTGFFRDGARAREESYILDERMRVGEILLERQAERVDNAIANGLWLKSKQGTRVIMFDGVTETSDAAEKLGNQFNLIVGFKYTVDEGQNPQLRFSVRSHTGYDCSRLAKYYDGGGHTAAAGFSLLGDTRAVMRDPFNAFMSALNAYEGILQQ